MKSCSLYLESVAGIAGDMFASSFVDAGLVSEKELASLPEKLGFPKSSFQIRFQKVIKATMSATHMKITVKNEEWKKAFQKKHTHSVSKKSFFVRAEDHDPDSGAHVHAHGDGSAHWHTHYVELDRLIAKSNLDDGTKKLARKIFQLIAEAEAEAHGISVDQVAFHEVGAVDSILDVTMAAYCIARVKPQQIYSSAIKLGRGYLNIAHGTHPIPPPATAKISRDFPIEAVPAGIARKNVELSTPTGVAILKALNPTFVEAWPTASKIESVGMGAGTMDLGTYPNVFRLVQFTEAKAQKSQLPFEQDQVIEVAINIDDDTAERVAWIKEKLLEKGALDAWTVAVSGKKNRSGVILSFLTEEVQLSLLVDWVLRHSTTFGVRYREWNRYKLARKIETRKTKQGNLRVKIGFDTNGKKIKEKPEFEDLKKIWEKMENGKKL